MKERAQKDLELERLGQRLGSECTEVSISRRALAARQKRQPE